MYENEKELQEDASCRYGCKMVPLKGAAKELGLPEHLVRTLAMETDEGSLPWDDKPTYKARLEYELIEDRRGTRSMWISRRSLDKTKAYLADARRDPETSKELRKSLAAGPPTGVKVGEDIYRADWEKGEIVPRDPANDWEGHLTVTFEGEPELTSLSDAAELLDVTVRQVQNLIKKGKLSDRKHEGSDGQPRGTIRVELDSLYRLLQERLGLEAG